MLARWSAPGIAPPAAISLLVKQGLAKEFLECLVASDRFPAGRRRVRLLLRSLRRCPHLWVDVLGNVTKLRPEGVVPLAQLRVGQHLVRLGDGLEPGLGTGI